MLRFRKAILLAVLISAVSVFGALALSQRAEAAFSSSGTPNCSNNSENILWSHGQTINDWTGSGRNNTWDAAGYQYSTYDFGFHPTSNGGPDAPPGVIIDCQTTVSSNFDSANHNGLMPVAAFLGAPDAGQGGSTAFNGTWDYTGGTCTPITISQTNSGLTQCTDGQNDTVPYPAGHTHDWRNSIGGVDDGGSVYIGPNARPGPQLPSADKLFCFDIMFQFPPQSDPYGRDCPTAAMVSYFGAGNGGGFAGAGFVPHMYGRDITCSIGTVGGCVQNAPLNNMPLYLVAENTHKGGFGVSATITFKYPLPYNNHATLTSNSPPANSFVKSGDTISLAPGMYNDGSGIGGATTVQLTNPNLAYFQVVTTPPIPQGGDPYVTGASYGGGSTSATWQRSKSPGMSSSDPNWSIVQYSPIVFRVIGNPPPGNYCFTTVVTPQNNAGGTSTASACFRVAPPVASCIGMTIEPVTPQPGESFKVTPTFSLSFALPTTVPYTVTLNAPGLAPNPSFANGTVIAGTTSGNNATINGLTANVGRYSGTFTISSPNFTSPPPCPFGVGLTIGPIVVASKPYLRVYGGDVLAGGGFGDGCPSTNANIIAYNNGLSSGYTGAGVQFAAQAKGAITEFASATLRAPPTGVPNPPKGLSFANTGASSYGGNFNAVACSSDYWSGKPAATTSTAASPSVSVTGLTGAVYYKPTDGKLILTGGSIANGARPYVYVDGNVNITSNISYANTTWGSVSAIPSFYLIVTGNIYIQPNVTNLDGVYIAQNTGIQGMIYTCSAGFVSDASDANFASTCGNQLVINGAFVANQVKFLRAKGTLLNAASGDANVAEIFNYRPELWLVPGPNAGGGSDYDAINSLPPVL